MACGTEDSWRPVASLEVLRLRADLLEKARRFFLQRGVMEVDTPVLGACAVSDVHIHSLQTRLTGPAQGPRYLQTSPESAMKRLLAAGSGPIFQLARAFRDGEAGRLHNPEFLLLEWYRPGFDLAALMDEVEALLDELLGAAPPARRLTYREAFRIHAGMDPFSAPAEEINRACRHLGMHGSPDDRDAGLDLILSERVQPGLGQGRTFLDEFPASQAALARIRADDPPVAERFELFVDAIEIANGYQELDDAEEQRRRFSRDLTARRKRGMSSVPEDRHLLAALEHGLPNCAGVALGFDRVVLLAAGLDDVAQTMAFPVGRA